MVGCATAAGGEKHLIDEMEQLPVFTTWVEGMDIDEPRPPVGFLGLLVVGGASGFALYMAARSGTVTALAAAVRADLYLVVTTLVVVSAGVAMALYYGTE